MRETVDMMNKTYGSDCMSLSRMYEWFRRFKQGREVVTEDLRQGRPSTKRMTDAIEFKVRYASLRRKIPLALYRAAESTQKVCHVPGMLFSKRVIIFRYMCGVLVMTDNKVCAYLRYNFKHTCYHVFIINMCAGYRVMTLP